MTQVTDELADRLSGLAVQRGLKADEMVDGDGRDMLDHWTLGDLDTSELDLLAQMVSTRMVAPASAYRPSF